MKALRMSEEQYQATLKRNAKALSDWSPTPKAHKFGAEKTEGYDSKLEARRAHELELLQKSGAISELAMQRTYVLMDAQYGSDGALIERPATYRADFTYRNAAGELVVEDCKGYRKGMAHEYYVLKRKLLLQRYGLRIIEITR